MYISKTYGVQGMINCWRSRCTIGSKVREKRGVLGETKLWVSDEIVHVEEQLRVTFCEIFDACFWRVADNTAGFSG